VAGTAFEDGTAVVTGIIVEVGTLLGDMKAIFELPEHDDTAQPPHVTPDPAQVCMF